MGGKMGCVRGGVLVSFPDHRRMNSSGLHLTRASLEWLRSHSNAGLKKVEAQLPRVINVSPKVIPTCKYRNIIGELAEGG